MKTFKRIISILLVSCLLFCAAPSTFATESDNVPAATAESGDIIDNPIFQGAIADILAMAIDALIEGVGKYIQMIIDLINKIEAPYLPEAPVIPDLPDTPVIPDAPEQGEDTPADSEEIQPAA